MGEQRDNNRQIARQALVGAARTALRRPHELRYGLVRDSWSGIKRLGAEAIEDVEIREIPCVQDAVLETYLDDPNRGVIAALCRGIEARTFFEIGTNRGRTAWTVARNNPEIEVHTLDLPDQGAVQDVALDLNDSDRDFFVETWDRGEAFAGTPEAERINQLWGDSASFDFSPYRKRIDFVFIDGAHSHSYVRNDTEVAMEMVADGGLIAWDDYPRIPGVYRALNEIAASLERPPIHILGTRLVVLGADRLLERLSDADVGRLHRA